MTSMKTINDGHIDFEWIWSDINSNAQGDKPSSASIKICSRVRYEDLSNSLSVRRLLQHTNNTKNTIVKQDFSYADVSISKNVTFYSDSMSLKNKVLINFSILCIFN